MRRQTKFTGISPAVWRECWERDGGICRHCGKGGVLQAAHYVSRARGGMGIPTNLVMLCPECHREADQGDGKEIKREMREYLQSLGSFTGALGTFESVYDGENFPELMLVLCGFSQPMVNAFLTLLKATRLPAISLKAILTETNQGWNSLELHDELLKEHEALKKGKPLHEQEPSE